MDRNLLLRCIIITILINPAVLFSEDKQDALLLFSMGKYAEAEKVCLEEIKETPKRIDSYVVLGWSLLGQNKFKEATLYAEKALTISRHDRRIIYIVAEGNFFLGNNEKALKYLEEYAYIAPSGGKLKFVYYFMGEIYIRLGQYSNSDIAFSTALHYDNKNTDWWSRLGYTREKGKEYKWALEAYNNALKLNPNHTEAKRGKSNIEQILGQ